MLPLISEFKVPSEAFNSRWGSFAGTWAGLRLYARLDEAVFRKVVLGLLLISGLGLLVRGANACAAD